MKEFRSNPWQNAKSACTVKANIPSPSCTPEVAFAHFSHSVNVDVSYSSLTSGW